MTLFLSLKNAPIWRIFKINSNDLFLKLDRQTYILISFESN